MGEITIAKKREVGASLVWALLNQVNAAIEELDQHYLQMTRVLLEHKRRLDALDISVSYHRKILSATDSEVGMTCIACPCEFKLPRGEAREQDFTVPCPQCGSWAILKDKIPQEYSIRDIARISGRGESTVAQVMRKEGFKRRGEHRLYNEETAQQVLGILEKKRSSPARA